ncbi:maestro heat-like repeat-containing protein family member 9 isoform X2 [Peromyscus eremicus]|uniref:maestro heat-like repeat-containing protein family member 9 isoform X2 n=1 Tax=Peromyscus eremicus TaxID=42410 RepID=UPI0027DE1C10|nr:maestro heat-like repeat-containing protein family member 9 isoform X2 [Peromyscus eremicus]
MAQDTSNTMTRLQTLQTTVKWYHVEFKAEILLDTYSTMLSDQSIILAMNSSFIDPSLQFESQLRIIELSFKKAFSLPTLNTVKSMGKNPEEIRDLQSLYENIFNVYEDTLIILVSKDFYKIQILKEMVTWMSQNKQYLQERVMMLITRVLIFASRRVKKYPSIDAPCLGLLAAELSLLCAHEDPLITQQAITGMNYVLKIAMYQKSNLVKRKSSVASDRETNNPKEITSDFELLSKTMQGDRSKIAQSVGQTLLPHLLSDFVWTLLRKLFSSNKESALEAAFLLNLTLEYHAQKITTVSKIVDDIYEQLSGNFSHPMNVVLLRVISLLTRAFPKKVIFQLMEFPVPADNALLLMWQAASADSRVAPQVLKTILTILKGKPVEMEETLVERRRFSLDATNMMPVAASQALCTFLPVKSYKKVVAKLFPEFLMALMLQLFYCSQLLKDTAQNRSIYVRDGLKVLLNSSGLKEVDDALEKKNFWDQFSQVMDHQYGIHLIAKTLSECNFPQFPETLHYVYKVAVEGPRRSEDSIVTIIFFAELLNNFFKESLPKEFLVLFRNWINDPNPSVGKMSLQKIASMAPVFSELENVCNLLLPVLDAFLSKEYTVVIRAMLTLRNILSKLDKEIYSTVCTRIASSYCPLMDHACRYTLTICFSQLKWSISHLLREENYCFESVVLNICNNLLSSYESYITDLISGTLGFLWSSRTFLKKGATILIGYLGKSGAHLLLKEEIDVMIEVIERVARDEDPVIKLLAEKTRKIFREIAYRIASSTIRQTFRRWAMMFHTKKLKLIYDLANITSLEESIPEDFTEVKPEDNPENLVEEKPEYLFQEKRVSFAS